MKYIVLLTLTVLVAYSAPLGAQDDWVEARLMRQRPTTDPSVVRCFYRVVNSVRPTTILVEGGCPRRIEIDFESREWRAI